MYKNNVSIAPKGIGVAMGIVVIVLNILGTLNNGSAMNLLGIGVVALGMAALQK